MIAYYTLSSLIICGSLLFEVVLGRTTIPLGDLNKGQFRGEKVYYFICCIVLTLIVALRADFWTDAIGYSRIFNVVRRLSFTEVLTNTLRLTNAGEILFLVFTKVVSLFTDDHHTYFAIMSIITYLPIVKTIFKKSDAPFLSLLLLFTFGFYFSSFNVVRSCMVFGISTLLLDNIKDKKLISYVVCILMLSLVHAGAIVLIPIYFIQQVPLLNRKNFLFTICGIFVFVFGLDYFLSLFDRIIYDSFYFETYSGINLTTGAFGLIVPHLIVLILLILFANNFDINEVDARILLNGTFLWCIFGVLVLRIRIMTRMSDMMFIYPVLLVPKLLFRIRPRHDGHAFVQRILVFCFSILLLLWRLASLNDSPYNPYFTFFT